jgi:hypothetical protein
MGVRDPGYGSTSKMVTESALCLVRDVRRHVCFLGSTGRSASWP